MQAGDLPESLLQNCRTPCLVLLLAIALFAGACSREPSLRLRAGAAAVDVTPSEWPLPMVGTFSDRPASSAHDPLYARALVLDDGSTRVAIAVVDSCYIPREVLDQAKRRAAESAGIPTERMLISATHTHSAPPSAPGIGTRWPLTGDSGEAEERYSRLLIERIAAAIAAASGRLEPAEIGWGVATLPEEVFNRRWFMREGSIPPDPFGATSDQVRMNPPRQSPHLVRPAGPTDPDVSILSVRSAAGRPLALLANYSLHYVGGIPGGQVSADYFGEFARLIAERLAADGAGEHFVAILSNGTSGDVNNIDFTKPRPEIERFGKVRIVAGKVADKAEAAYRKIEHRPWVELRMAEREITLAVRKPTPEGYERAKQILAAEDEANPPRRAKPYARRAITLYEGPDTVAVKLQAIRIGRLGVAALPFETFAEIGLDIKKKSPLEPTFTIELANGANGYLPTPRQHAFGGYETWLGTNRVEVEASGKITRTLLELLDEVAAGR